MDLLKALETYTSAQKWVGINFVILGIILLVLSGVFFFFVSKSSLASGMKWGALVCGILIIGGGLSYINFCGKTQSKGESIHKKDVTEFIQFEHERMEKVDKGFLVYQLTFASFILASLIIIVFAKGQTLKGVAFAIAIHFLGILLIEGFSHQSISDYTNKLRIEYNSSINQ